MKKLVLIGALTFVLSGCSWFGWGGDSEMDNSAAAQEAKAAIASADSAIKASKKMGGEWRDAVKKYLKKAKAAAAKKDYKKAIKLAKTAEFQGMTGQSQAKEQASAGPWLF